MNLHSQEALLQLEKRVQTSRDDHDNTREAPERRQSSMYRLTSTSENYIAAVVVVILLFTTSMLTIDRT